MPLTIRPILARVKQQPPSRTFPWLFVAVLALPARGACRLGQRSCDNRAGSIDISNGKRRRLGDPGWCIRSEVQARAIAAGVHGALVDLLTSAKIELLPTSAFGGRVLYRARLSNLLPMQQMRLAPDWRPANSPARLSLPGMPCRHPALRRRPSPSLLL